MKYSKKANLEKPGKLVFTEKQLEAMRKTREEMDKAKIGYNKFKKYKKYDLELTDEQVEQIYKICNFTFNKYGLNFVDEDILQDIAVEITTKSLYSYKPEFQPSTFISKCAFLSALKLKKSSNYKDVMVQTLSLDDQTENEDLDQTYVSLIKDKSYLTQEKKEFIRFIHKNIDKYPVLKCHYIENMPLVKIGDNAKELLGKENNVSKQRIENIKRREIKKFKKLCIKQGFNYDILNNDQTL